MQPIAIRFPEIGDYGRDWLDANFDKQQAILSQCKGQNPLCLCQPDGVPMYIAFRHIYYLARLPNSGPRHAPSCPSYEPDPSLCGRGIYDKSALVERSDGMLSVRLGVPIKIRGSNAEADAVDPTTAEDPPSKETSTRSSKKKAALQLTGLLHLLWDRAGFNRWSPNMAGRRHYRQIFKFISATAQELIVQRKPLDSHLYIPEPYSEEDADNIDTRRTALFRSLMQSPRGEPQRMVVLGQVKALVTGESGFGIRLAHTPSHLIFWFDERLMQRFYTGARFALPDYPQMNQELPVFVILAVERAKDRSWRAIDLGGMVTTKEFIPVCSIEETIMIRRLIEGHRFFYKPLAYDASYYHFANFLLTDGDRAVALEIVGEHESDKAIAVRNQRISHYGEKSDPFWVWDVFDHPQPPAFT